MATRGTAFPCGGHSLRLRSPSGSERGLLWRKASCQGPRLKQQKGGLGSDDKGIVVKQGSPTVTPTVTYFQAGWLQAREGEKSDIYSASAIGYARPLNPEGWSRRAPALA